MSIDINFAIQNGIILEVDSNGNNIAHRILIQKHDNHTTLIDSVEQLLSLTKAAQLFHTKNNEGRTPLHCWIKSDNLLPNREFLERILRTSKEDINAVDTSGDTMYLSTAGRPVITSECMCLIYLKANGANFRARSRSGLDALKIAENVGNAEIIKYLLSNEMVEYIPLDYRDNPLLWVAFRQRLGLVKSFIERRENVLSRNSNNENIAHFLLGGQVVSKEELDASVAFLLSLSQRKQLFEMRNSQGRTPLQEHIWCCNYALDNNTIAEIMKFGSVDMMDNEGRTLFMSAARNESFLPCLQMLSNAGADRHRTNEDGNALHLALTFGNMPAVKYIVSTGFALEHRDKKGNTPLLIAAYCRRTEGIKYLIESGANVMAVNNGGDNVAHMVMKPFHYGCSTLLEAVRYLLLLDEGAALFKMKNGKRQTPLHEWVDSTNDLPDTDIITRILSTSGEDVNATNINGKNMMTMATTKKKDSCSALVYCLKTFGAYS